MLIIVNVIVAIIWKATCTNLIQKGDFQYYHNLSFSSAQNQLVANIQSNTSEWYDKALDVVQIKQIVSRYTTLAVDLSNGVPMSLCQNVSLVIGATYNLSFGLYSPAYCQNMIGKAYINDILATQLTIPLPDTFSYKSYLFNATFFSNMICFNQSHDAAPNRTYMPNRGGFIDNISLLLAYPVNSTQNQNQNQTQNTSQNCTNITHNQTKTLIIAFYFEINEIQQTVTLSSNILYTDELANQLMKQFLIVFENKSLIFQVKADLNGKLCLLIEANISLTLNKINFVKKLSQNSSIQLKLFIQTNNEINKFIYLDGQYINLMNNTKNALFFINQGLNQASSFSRIVICSYLINLIIDFQILSLYYVFLQISIVPDFTKKIYYEILEIVYSSSSFLDYLRGLLPQKLGSFEFKEEEKIPERISVEKNNEPWFGTYGISSHIINSNFENLFSLVWLFLRLILLRLIIKFILYCASCSKKLISKFRFRLSTVLLAQFCYMTPTLIISIFPNLTYSNENSTQYFYQASSILFLYLTIISLFLYSLIPKMKEKKGKKKSPRKIKILKKKPRIKLIIKKEKSLKQLLTIKQSENQNLIEKYFSYSKYSQQAFSMPIFFTVPFLVYIGIVELFLVINSIVIVLRLIGIFIYKTKKSSKVKKTLQFLSSIIWVIHHIIFTTLYIIQRKKSQENNFNLILILGISAIFTVLIGLLLEIVKLIILFGLTVRGVVKIVINIIKKCRNSQKKEKQNQKSDKIKQGISQNGSQKQKQQAHYIVVEKIQKIETKNNIDKNNNPNLTRKYMKQKKKTYQTYSNISKLMQSAKTQIKKQRVVKFY